MRVRYVVPLREPIRLEDHWPIPIMGGDLRVVSRDGMATAFEITFTGQSVDLAPAAEQHEGGKVKLSITMRDRLLPPVEKQLENAFAYLKCYFDLEVLITEFQTEYVGETDKEEKQITIIGASGNREKNSLSMPYDLLARPIMAAEYEQAPTFEATLVSVARTALLEGRYIDSFQYAFLLMESVYGGGKFKSVHLKQALKGNADCNRLIATALTTRRPAKESQKSDTAQLLAGSPTVEAVIDHLVEKKGFYFHGNVKRQDAWRPHEQEAAEALALFSLEVAMLIAQEAAAPMFDERFSQLYLDNAKRVGAIMTMNVSFRFREPEEPFDREGSMNISAPGTKVTPKMAVDVARSFLERFEDIAPIADLKSATCRVRETGQRVFDMNFHIETDSVVDA